MLVGYAARHLLRQLWRFASAKQKGIQKGIQVCKDGTIIVRNNLIEFIARLWFSATETWKLYFFSYIFCPVTAGKNTPSTHISEFLRLRSQMSCLDGWSCLTIDIETTRSSLDNVSEFSKISMLNTFRSSSAYVIQFWFWHSGNWCNSSALTEESKLCRQNVTYDWKGNWKTENDRRKNKLHICNPVSRHHLPVQSRELLTAIDTKFVISLLFHQAPLV